jgi:low affinity Fe/Cu permease
MKEALITIGMFVTIIPTVIFIMNFFLYKNDRIEKKIEQTINQECIKGNKVAIELKKDHYFRCSAKDEDLIHVMLDIA